MYEELKNAAIGYGEKFFLRDWKSIFDAPDRSRNYIALLGPSFYVLCLDGTMLAIDPSIMQKSSVDDVADRLSEDFSKLDGILITHGHSDHFNVEITRLTLGSDVKWYLSEKLDAKSVERSMLDNEKIIRLSPYEKFKIGKLEITPFPVIHTDEGGTNFMDELGYCIESSLLKIVFTADVRNYSSEQLPDFGSVDAAVMHVWLGRENALKLPCEPYLGKFCAFAQKINPKKIFLGHLYETSRSAEDMWTYTHAGAVMDKMLCCLPDTEVLIPKQGRIYYLP